MKIKMKSLFVLFSIFTMLLSISCGDDNSKSDEKTDADVVTDSEEAVNDADGTTDDGKSDVDAKDDATNDEDAKDDLNDDGNDVKDDGNVEPNDEATDDGDVEPSDEATDGDIIEDTEDDVDSDGIEDTDSDTPDTVLSDIAKIRKGDIAVNTELEIKDVVVVSPIVKDKYKDLYSFYVSEKDGSAGITVYKASRDVEFSTGDVVTIDAVVAEYEGLIELKGKVTAKTGTATVPAAISVAKADLNDSYRGKLVTVSTNLKVAALPVKENGYLVLFEGEDNFSIGNYYANSATNGLAVGDVVTSITGIYDFAKNKNVINVLADGAIVEKAAE